MHVGITNPWWRGKRSRQPRRIWQEAHVKRTSAYTHGAHGPRKKTWYYKLCINGRYWIWIRHNSYKNKFTLGISGAHWLSMGLPEISWLTLIGVENMVTPTGLRYTRDYLTPGVCSLIKPTAMENPHSHVTIISNKPMRWYVYRVCMWLEVDWCDYFSHIHFFSGTVEIAGLPWGQIPHC